jgi:hypothetical protein
MQPINSALIMNQLAGRDITHTFIKVWLCLVFPPREEIKRLGSGGGVIPCNEGRGGSQLKYTANQNVARLFWLWLGCFSFCNTKW